MADPTTAEQAMESGDFEEAIKLMEAQGAAQAATDDATNGQNADDHDAGGETPAGAGDQAQQQAAGDGQQAAKADDAPAAASQAAGDKIDGVLAKDGKTVIPYSVLEATRRRAAENETMVTQLQQDVSTRQQELDTLKAQMAELRQKAEATATPGASTPAAATGSDQDDPLAGLDPDDLPEPLVKAMRALSTKLKAAESRLETQTQELAQLREAPAVAQAADSVQADIDANPTLVSWQAENPAAFKAAADADDRLKAMPEWKGKPRSERFAAVVQIVCAEKGFKPVQATAKKNGADADAATAAVTSISDLPGGAIANQTGTDALANASGRQTLAMMANMSDDQLERMLQGLG